MTNEINIKLIGLDDLKLLRRFVNELGGARLHFRYFSSRPLNVILNHLVTLLAVDSQNAPLAYGHLDVENNVVWLGVCVLPRYWGKGLGKSVVQRLLQEAVERRVELVMLSVDSDNAHAISLYTKLGFIFTEQRGDKVFFGWKSKTELS